MSYLFVTTGIFLLDFFIKRHMDRNYTRKERHPRLGGRVLLELYYNDGAALNLLSRYPRVMRAFHTCAILAAGVAYYFTLRLPGQALAKTGLSMLLGGGANNLYDRYAKGHVVDYFRFNFGPKCLRRIVFNLSDFFVFFGALLAAAATETGQNTP